MRAIGESMGLPPHVPPTTPSAAIIYHPHPRNWHLLPYERCFSFSAGPHKASLNPLREGRFLWVKLGSIKPDCPSLRYAEPDENRPPPFREIKVLLVTQHREELRTPRNPRFVFVDELFSQRTRRPHRAPQGRRTHPLIHSI